MSKFKNTIEEKLTVIQEENYEYKWTSDFKVVEQLNGKRI